MASKQSRKNYLNNPNLPAVGTEFEYTPEMAKDILLCQQDILYFAENFFFIINLDEGRQKIKLHPFQRETLEMIHDNRFNLLLFSRQVGKALALDTPIKTTHGWSTMGDIKVGDVVYGANGQPCNVTHAHEVLYDRECYEVVFDSGDVIVADGEHLWFTQTVNEQFDQNSGSVKTTKQILDTINEQHRVCRSDTGKWFTIVDIKQTASVPVRCISVDSEDKLFLVGASNIPTHNSTIATIYILWHAIFNADQAILLVANKEETAKEIFSRVRLAFEELPNWLKPGVKEYGKEGMELANGSKIRITTTTSNAGRGQACNMLFIDEADFIECVSGDTMITLKDKDTNKILHLPIAEAYQSSPQNISTENTNKRYEILTADGFKSFSTITKNDNRSAVVVKFDDGSQIIVSNDHEFLCASTKFTLASKARYKKIKTVDGYKTVTSVRKLANKISLYDVCDVDGSTYITNNVVSHNCNLLEPFWSSVFPIISSSKKSKIIMASTPRDTSGLFYRLYQKSLEEDNMWKSKVVTWDMVPGRDEAWKRQTMAGLDDPLKFRTEFECEFGDSGEVAVDNELLERLRKRCVSPQHTYMDGAYKLWDTPQPGRIYVVGVDVSEGVSKDYTVVTVLDLTDLRHIIQVATYAVNTIQPIEFTPKLFEILRQWGCPHVLIERNGCGAVVVDNLRKDFKYENIVNFGAKEISRTKIPLGVLSHSYTKYISVTNARYWINACEAVQINDKTFVEELKDFQRKPTGNWSAKPGKHDDRVMSLYWALAILNDKLVDKFFEIQSTDENHKPLVIKPHDFHHLEAFASPRSFFQDEKQTYNEILPAMFGGITGSPDIDDLQSAGWNFLRDENL